LPAALTRSVSFKGEILGAREKNARLEKELAAANSSVEAASNELAASSEDNQVLQRDVSGLRDQVAT